MGDTTKRITGFRPEHYPEQIKEICKVIGDEAATRLWEEFTGRTIYIPTFKLARGLKRAEKIRQDYQNGATVIELVEKYNVSNVWIYQLIKDLREIPRKAQLEGSEK